MHTTNHPLNPLDSASYLAHECEAQQGDLLRTTKTERVLTFNGIALPDALIQQLKQLSSVPISRLTRAEIEEAVLNFEGDAELSEDPHGHSLMDKMRLTWDEIKHHSHNFSDFTFVVDAPAEAASQPETFVERLARESESKSMSWVDRYLNSTNHSLSPHPI